MTDKTNWDAYYRNSLHPITRLTRAISTKKLLALFREVFLTSSGPLAVCELGGANSCFAEAICEKYAIGRYHVVDTNCYGLELLKENKINSTVSVEKGDVSELYKGTEQFDVVFSVGLIEHFHPVGTVRSIESHFARCKPGGFVIMSFPTPTWLYRMARYVLELFGMWGFPDERPLLQKEVVDVVERYGLIQSCTINWWIVLTQCNIVARKV